MNKIMSAFKAFVIDENAVAAIEYTLMAALLAVSIVVGMKAVGNDLVAAFTSVRIMFDNAFP